VTADEATCWTLIHAAAEGEPAARANFARLYEPVARSYLASRWRQSPCLATIDDAVQDLFVELFKASGVLDKVVQSQPEGFRAFLHGVLKNIARRHEAARGVSLPVPDDQAGDETSPSRAFDRAWAQSLLQEAARVQSENAAIAGERALRRMELLRLRFQEGLPIREIAAQWNEDPAKLHHEYATARDEFRFALRQVVAFHLPNASASEIETACRQMLDALN